MKFSAADLLMSLILGLFWAITCYFAWSKYSKFKECSTPDRLGRFLFVEIYTYGELHAMSSDQLRDAETFKFLRLASPLLWGTSVWFILIEPGLVPGPDDDKEFDAEHTDDYIGE